VTDYTLICDKRPMEKLVPTVNVLSLLYSESDVFCYIGLLNAPR